MLLRDYFHVFYACLCVIVNIEAKEKYAWNFKKFSKSFFKRFSRSKFPVKELPRFFKYLEIM